MPGPGGGQFIQLVTTVAMPPTAAGQEGDVGGFTATQDGARLRIFNKSNADILWSTQHLDDQVYTPAGWVDDLPLEKGDTAVHFKCLFVLATAPQDNNVRLLYYDQRDVPREGFYRGPVNPVIQSIPVGAIAPGPLPEGVTIGADDVGVAAPSEALGAFATVPFAQVTPGGTTPDTATQYQFVQTFGPGTAIVVIRSPVNDALTHDIIGLRRIQNPGGTVIGYRVAIDNTNDLQFFDTLANQFDVRFGSTGMTLTSGGRILAWSQFNGSGPGTFNHGLGVVPLAVFLSPNNAAAQTWAINTLTSTQVTVAIGAGINWTALAIA